MTQAILTEPDGYILARTRAEEARLRAQAEVLEPLTRRVLARAGVGAGMRCLDAGCGSGAVTRLIAEVIGPSGLVVGVDVDDQTGRRSIAALRSEFGPRVAFVAADVMRGDQVEGAPFDVVVARLLICHMTDPVDAVRRLAALLRPGGRLVLVDYDMSRLAARPEHPAITRGFEVVTECFRRSGKAADAGLRLAEFMAEAGLPEPDGYEIEAIFGPVATVGGMLESVLASLTPAAAALGIATAEEVAALRDEVRSVVAAGGRTALGPLVIGAWTTAPNLRVP